MKAIINYRYRRMAHTTGDKCQLPLLMLSNDVMNENFLSEIKSITENDSLSFSDEGKYSSIWVNLPANTIFDLSDEDDYAQVLNVNNKFSEIDWNEYTVFIQRSHVEAIPNRYDVQFSEEENLFQILRYNFGYNYYVSMQKLPLFDTEADAWNYIDQNLEDW